MKKLFAMALAIMMVLSLATTAFAANGDTYSITIKSTDGHTYEAYQIFSGTLGADGTLGNLAWGSSVDASAETDLGSAQTVADTLTDAEDAAAFAETIAPYLTAPVKSTSQNTDGTYVIDGLEPGYYLVKDAEDSLTAEGESYTHYILAVVKDTEVKPKADVPEFVKKVKDTNDTTGETSGWQDSADHDIGDDVPFQLKATLANDVESYSSYKVVFHDTLSAGLTFNEDSVTVYVDGELVESGYTVVANPADDCTFEVVITDAKDLGATNNSVIIVEYTAELNTDAVLGAEGNPNVAYLEYSNNPNWKPDTEEGEDEDDSPTGETPEDKVIVFTYEVIVDKVDQDGKALAGAGFTLYKKDPSGNWNAIGEEVTGGTSFTWTGLDDGEYKLVETTTPDGYNTIDDIYFTIEATHDEESDDPELKTLVVKDAEGNIISAEGDENATFNVTMSSGEIKTEVINQSGATLPETGGVGTTIFYVLGAVMVLGAAILLITKKRMAA